MDPERDRVTFDGKPLKAAHKVYRLLYKPKGYLTTFKDPEGRPTVYDLLKDKEQWVFPVGRLDQDTSGLLLLTNDSEFGDYVSSPESHVPKTYLVKSSRLLTDEELDQLRNGLQLVDGPTRPAVVERVRDTEKYSFIEITITEGRNRQVRRMVEALRAKVLKLVRVRVGNIRIGDLQIGTARELTEQEVKALFPRHVPDRSGGSREKVSSNPRADALGLAPPPRAQPQRLSAGGVLVKNAKYVQGRHVDHT